MTDLERQAIWGVCQQATMADGSASSAEQQALRKATDRLGISPPPGGVSETPDLGAITAPLRGSGHEATALELAWGICAADGPPNRAEQWFLEALRGSLSVPTETAEDIRRRVAALVATPIPASTAIPPPPAPPVIPGTSATPVAPDLEETVQNAAIMAGALELLPHTLATLAIVPLQMRLVYRVGKAYGYELDSGHVREFLAVAGVSMASQVVEGFAERTARGLFGSLLGGFVGHLASQATGSGVAFASTYAVGELARQYYAAGRSFSAIQLREAYDRLLERGRALQSGFGPRIRSQAQRIDTSTLASLVRG
jgi:uncharacterized protein (DUF697 family)